MNYIDDVYTRYVKEKYNYFFSIYSKNCSKTEYKKYLEQDIKAFVMVDLKLIGISFKDVKFNFSVTVKYDYSLGLLMILADNKTINLFHKRRIEIERLSKLKNIFDE
jgi:hypothetical protein